MQVVLLRIAKVPQSGDHCKPHRLILALHEIHLFGSLRCPHLLANWLEAPQPVVGKHVQVALKSGVTQRGILEAVAQDSLTLEGRAPIGRSDIRLVQVRTGMSRGKRASRGAKIGAITGASSMEPGLLSPRPQSNPVEP